MAESCSDSVFTFQRNSRLFSSGHTLAHSHQQHEASSFPTASPTLVGVCCSDGSRLIPLGVTWLCSAFP